jgi:hypothetical protein
VYKLSKLYENPFPRLLPSRIQTRRGAVLDMSDSQAKSVQLAEAGATELPVDFRFSVTWSYLFAPATHPNAIGRDSAPPILLADSPGNRAEQAREVEPLCESKPSLDAIPNLYPSLSLPAQFGNGWKLLLGVALLAGLVVPIWHALPARSPAKSVAIQPDMLGGGWLRETASGANPGAKQARQLILYQPSLNVMDGQFEFTWNVDNRGVGWVFRATDVANYYAMRIKALSLAPSLRLSVEHFSVLLGEEGTHSEKVLVFPRFVPTMRVKVDIAGPSFTLYLQGNAVDYWNDTRLTVGGFGFYEEWRQAGDVRAIRMSYSRSARFEPQPEGPGESSALSPTARSRASAYRISEFPQLASGGA